MKPRPHIRKTIKWTSAVMVVVLMLAWAVSLRWHVGFDGAEYFGGVFPHSIHINRPNSFVPQSPAPTGWTWGENTVVVNKVGSQSLRPVFEFGGGRSRVVLPFWLPLMPAIAFAALAWRLDAKSQRRMNSGRCAQCGYERAGLKDSSVPCPECGARP